MKIIEKIAFGIISLIFLCVTGTVSGSNFDFMPADHKELKSPLSYDQMIDFLSSLPAQDFITVETAGKTVEGRYLKVVKLDHKKSLDPWRVFFYAQQHGNEPAGKDALLYIIRRIAEKPESLPDDVSLWIIPMVNPDGAEANQRRNGNGADLNRDHQTLAQPEVQALYQTFRKFMPHVAVDCHEFARDSKDFAEKGWLEWPLIMMDTANHPLFSSQLVQAGTRWVDQVAPYMAQKGHNYTRYHVGGVPPDEEQRYSSPEVDDGRNGMGAYGGLSFIIESGVKRNADNENEDLGQRVDAYIDLLTCFVEDDSHRMHDRKLISESRSGRVPDFIPTNYFWGSLGQKIFDAKVISLKSGKEEIVKTANFMTDMIVKDNVNTPSTYAIKAQHAQHLISLLKHHDLDYTLLAQDRKVQAQGVELVAYIDEYDEIYNRYAGRQTVKPHADSTIILPRGSILVNLDRLNAVRAILLLEPNMMYSIYNSEVYRNLADEENILPVWRIMH